MNSLLDLFSTMSGFPGEAVVLMTALGIIIVRSPREKRRSLTRNAVFLFVAFILFRLTGRLLKVGLAVPRPCWNPDHPSLIPCPASFSFPSGHALGSGMVAVLVGLMTKRRMMWIFGVSGSLVIAASRVALGVHAPLDVIGGLVLGYSFGWMMWRAFWK